MDAQSPERPRGPLQISFPSFGEPRMLLSVVIPCMNEEEVLRETNRRLHCGHRRRNASQMTITRANTQSGIKAKEAEVCRRESHTVRKITTAKRQTLNSQPLAEHLGSGRAGVLARSEAAIARFNAVSGGTGRS